MVVAVSVTVDPIGVVIIFYYLQACKGALQKLGPLVKSDKVNDMFQKHLNPEESLLYPDFLNDLCKLLVSWLQYAYMTGY